jgi:hypothetical protein
MPQILTLILFIASAIVCHSQTSIPIVYEGSTPRHTASQLHTATFVQATSRPVLLEYLTKKTLFTRPNSLITFFGFSLNYEI